MTDFDTRKTVNQQPMQQKSEKEGEVVLPSLKAYQSDHTETHLKKLCFEIAELCRAVYASTKNETERKIYRGMIDKLYKQ